MTAELQADIQTLIRTVSGFDSADVTLGDFRCLDNGSPPYAVILPGPFTATEETYSGGTLYTWTIYVEIITQFQDDSYAPINTARESVITKLNSNPTLGNPGEPIDAMVRSGAELFYTYPAGGAEQPQFVGQRLSVIVEQTVDHTI